ncbi:MAG TPA: TadE/TadG family type IV pilus assembly protein [Coriobacteriia bacterium]
MKPIGSPRSPRVRGQGLVEFALVLPIFLLLLFGLLDMGRGVYSNNTLSQAAREAARLAATQAFWVGKADPACNAPAGPVCPPVGTLKANVDAAAARTALGLGALQVYLRCDPATGSPPTGAWTGDGSTCDGTQTGGDLVSVRVAYNFTMVTPIVGQIANNLPMSASATMLIN